MNCITRGSTVGARLSIVCFMLLIALVECTDDSDAGSAGSGGTTFVDPILNQQNDSSTVVNTDSGSPVSSIDASSNGDGSNVITDTDATQDASLTSDTSQNPDATLRPDTGLNPDTGLIPDTGLNPDANPIEAGELDAGPSGNGAYPEPATVADYNQPGPYGPVITVLNQGLGIVSEGSSALLPLPNSNDPSGFTLFYPEGGQPGEIFPILTFGNGTMCSPTFYDEFIDHVVSYGYIVIAPNTSNTGSAVEMLQGVEWVIEQNDKPDSPLYGRVDIDRIGAMGHSQGGAGTCRAGADPRISAIAALSGTSSVDQIQCPAFFLTSGDEAGSSPDERINSTLSQTAHPSMYGIAVGGTHDEYADVADEAPAALIGLTSNDGLYSRGPVAAWFDWQLKGWESVGELFLRDPCAFCNAKNLRRLDLAGF